ncbi:hypothetical protein Sango_0799800 [Sesamum angolense]|uniref:DUF4218 domain-containing protein n=1 Tax=Sesamum angolense TaxID=2727404 RepID=A0AAE2C0A2_9LAMI|nr:hypothetical protein Sango_0799800 [Sesamum angolense]
MLEVHKLHELENNVAIILCNLEKIFPPAFFNSMEHLIVHLPYEASLGGLVEYRWMCQFERFLSELKKVKNKAHVETSIVEAYIVEEIGMLISQYFEPDVQSKRSMPRRNDECMSDNDGFQVHLELNYTDKELLKCHYWGPSAEVTSVPTYFVNEYNFQTDHHNTGKSTMNCGGCGRGRDRGSPRAEPADPTPATPSSKAVSQPPQIPTDSGTVGSYAARLPVHRPRIGRGMHQRLQRHYLSHRSRGITSASRMRGPTAILTLPSIMRSKGINGIPRPTSHRSHKSTNYSGSRAEGKLATGGTATIRACSRSSSSRPESFCGNSLPMPTTSWLDRYGWPRRSGASFWSFSRA